MKTTENIKIVEANHKDLELIKGFMLHALQTDPFAFTVDHSEYEFAGKSWWEKYLQSYFWKHKGRMFLVKDGETLSGMAGLLFRQNRRGRHVASLVWMYIDSKYRGKGFSKQLLQHIIDYAQGREDLKKIVLHVNETQESALKLYKKFGFKQVGCLEEELKIEGQMVDTFVMERKL